MRCKKCGQALSRGQTVCPSCGNSVEKQIRRTRNLRRFLVVVLLIVLCTAALLFLNLRSRGELPDLSLTTIRSLFTKEEKAPAEIPSVEETAPVEPEAEPTEAPAAEPEEPAPAEEEPAVPAPPAEPEEAPAEAEEAAPAEASAPEAEEPPVEEDLISEAEKVPAAVPTVNETAEAPAEESAALTLVEQFRAVETESFAHLSALLCAQYGQERAAMLNDEGQQALLSYRLTLGDLARRAVEDYSGMSMSWLKTLALSADSRSNGETAGMDLRLSVNDAFVASAQLVYDLLSGRTLVSIPELSGQTFALEAEETGSSPSLTRAQLAAVAEALPVEEELDALLQKYFAILIRNVSNVERGSDVLEAEGILGTYATLTLTLDEAGARRAAASLVGELRWDEAVRTVIEGVAEARGLSPDTSYEDFLSRLDELDSALARPTGGGGSYVLTVYVDEDGSIRGQRFLYDGYDDAVLLGYAVPRDGERFGLELLYARGEDRYELAGRGTCTEDTVSGEFLLRSGGERLARLSLTRVGNADGQPTVDLTVVPSQSVYAGLFPEALADYAHDLSIVLHSEAQAESAAGTAELRQSGETALTLAVDQSVGSETAVDVPVESVTREAWLADLTVESFEGILAGLKEAGMPAGLLTRLQNTIADAFGAAETD